MQDENGRGEGEFDLRAALDLLVRRRWLVLGAALACVVVGALVTLRMPFVYRAKTTMLIAQSAPEVLQGVDEVYDLGGARSGREFYGTQYSVIRSHPVAHKAAMALGLNPSALAAEIRAAGPAPVQAEIANDGLFGLSAYVQNKLRMLELVEEGDRDKLLQALESIDPVEFVQGKLSVEPIRDSQLVAIAVQHTDPEAAAMIANAVADAYMEYNIDQKAVATRSAVDWLSDQVHELREKLRSSEMELYEFKKANNIISVSMEERQNMTSETLSQLNSSLSTTHARRLALESRRDRIQRIRSGELAPEAIAEVSSSPMVKGLKETQSKLRQELEELSLRYTEAHPRLVALRKKLAVVENNLHGEIDKTLEALSEEYAATVETEQRLRDALEEVKAEALELNKQEIDYKRLKRERDNNAELYELVLKREKETDLSRLLKVNNVSKLEPAVAPDLPVRPRKAFNLAVSLVLGLILGVGLAFAVDYLDNTIKSQEQVERLLGLPFLGMVPLIPGDKNEPAPAAANQRDHYIVAHPRSTVAECCRTVRTNILFMTHEQNAKRLMVTSTNPQEGKSLTVINVGITMAQSGARTVLIDTDMRRPRLHKSFGIGNEVGLSSAILGDVALIDAVHATDVNDLDLIPCGPIPPNPAELLHTESFRSLLAELSESYDRVILDSPPVGAVADPLVLAGMVDGTILVVRSNKTPWQAAAHTAKRLQDVGGRVYGALLNCLDLSGGRADGGGQYYYYRYGYGTYGNYSSWEDDKQPTAKAAGA